MQPTAATLDLPVVHERRSTDGSRNRRSSVGTVGSHRYSHRLPPLSKFWSLENPPSIAELGRYRWWVYFLAGPLRVLLGAAVGALGISFAVYTNAPQTMPQGFESFLTTLRAVAGLFGVMQAAMSVVGGIVTCWMLAFYCGYHNNAASYRYEAISTRVQVLLGATFSGFLVIPLVGVSECFCNKILIDPSDLPAVRIAEDVCGRLPLVVWLFVVSLALLVVSAVPSIWGFHLFFGVYASVSFLRFALTAFVNGIAFLHIALHRLYKNSEYWQSIEGDAKSQVHFFFLLIILNGILAVMASHSSSVYSLFASWRRSQVRMAADIAINFLVFWFEAAALCSGLWMVQLRDYFCTIGEFQPTFKSPLTDSLCSAKAAVSWFYCLICVIVILTILGWILAILSFAVLRPIEWPKKKRQTSHQVD